MDPNLADLQRAATNAANAGRWDEAVRLWSEIRTRRPSDPNALWGLGMYALNRGDAAGAVLLLREGHRAAPRDKTMLLTLATAARACSDAATEEFALQQALGVDPYFLPALLAKGAMLERRKDAVAASNVFGNALKIVPHEDYWPAELRSQLTHARDLVARHRAALHAHLSKQLGNLTGDLPSGLQERWTEAASIMAHVSTPYHSDCDQLYVPRIAATPFYDRSLFPWAAGLEAKSDIIREELLRALAMNKADFVPYINKSAGVPINQWKDLNHSTRWSALHLWQCGDPIPANLERCPQTSAALEAVGLAKIAGNCPNAMFSALAPRTRIPPHHGETNARLVVHLPLIVPKKCGALRVGYQQREWRVGEILVFDDSLEHEAWNDSDELRVVLIFDVWNPLLTDPERDIVNALTLAQASFRP